MLSSRATSARSRRRSTPSNRTRPSRSTPSRPSSPLGSKPTLLQRIRRKDQDGFLERFLLVFAAGHLPEPDSPWTDLPPLEPVVDWLRPLRAIAGASSHPEGLDVTLTAEARAAWQAWFVELVDHTAAASLVLGGFYRKLPSYLARLALILHALWNPADPTVPLTVETIERAIDLVAYHRVHIHRALPLIGTRETLERAIDLVAYHRVHIHRALPLIGTRETLRGPEHALADRILYLLAGTGEPDGWLSRTRLLVALGRPETGSANDLIDGLIAKGVIETRTVRTGGRPATHYRLAQ